MSNSLSEYWKRQAQGHARRAISLRVKAMNHPKEARKWNNQAVGNELAAARCLKKSRARGDNFNPKYTHKHDGKITTKAGLLWRNGKVIDAPEADAIAKKHGHSCAERLVKELERTRESIKPDVGTGEHEEILDAMRKNIFGVCPNDTNGDGNCGLQTCKVCHPENFRNLR